VTIGITPWWRRERLSPKNVAPNTVVGGTPAKFIKTVQEAARQQQKESDR
jgi:hypothetical protein